jgi:hypothetical protein
VFATARPRTLAALLVVVVAATATAVLAARPAAAKSDFSARPFMGWSSWSVESTTRPGYGRNWLTEGNIRNAADAMAGRLRAAGYTNINVDAGWNATLNWDFHTDTTGIPAPDPTRVPSGISALADYVHARGLKLGLYASAGLEKEAYDRNVAILGTSCRAQNIAVQPLTPTNMWGTSWKINYGNPCAQSYLDSIAARFAAWGVDFVKIDGVTQDNVPDIAAWSTAIDRSGRPMWLTASAWPVPRAAGAGLRPHANSVRIDTDVECYCATVSTWSSSVDDRWADLPTWLADLAPNYWPDLDSMPINNNTGQGLQDGLTDIERQSVMTFWSMASSPLYVGGDVYFLNDTAAAILTNPEVIAIDQAGVLPRRITAGTTPIWAKTVGTATYVAVYNLGGSPADITVNFSTLGLAGAHPVRDVVARTDLGTITGSWTATNVPAHGSRLVKVDNAGGAPAGYTWCADENTTCGFAGTASVAYGANGTFAYRTATDGVACANAVFGDPLPGVGKACYRRPVVGYEAEAGTRAGSAVVAGCPPCSGGQKVGALGGTGTLRITVDAAVAGPISLAIAYASADPRAFDLSVNGAAATRISVAASGGWETVAVHRTTVTLRAGSNTLTFANPDGWAPDLDRVELGG